MTVSTAAIVALPIGSILWPAPVYPSVTALLVVADLIASLFRRPLLKREDRLALYPAIAVAGVPLYATITGLAGPDLYRAGFSVYAPLALAIAAALTAGRAPRAACTAILVLIAFDAHLLRSRNLFDYAFDPLVVAVALVWCFVAMFRRLRSKGAPGMG